MDKLHSCSKNQTCLVTRIKCLLYVNRNRKMHSPFYLCSHLILIFCVTFFHSSSSGTAKHISIFNPNPGDIPSLPPPPIPNEIMVWLSQAPNIILTFCLHAAFRSEELGSFIEIKKENCADFLLIFVLFLRGSAEQCACKS